MRDVAIIGIGQVPVGEHWATSLRELGSRAVRRATADANVSSIDALYVGNMLAGSVSGQRHLGPLIAQYAGYSGVECLRIESACGSGGAVVHAATRAVASGMADVVVAVGVEKMTDRSPTEVTAELATAADADFEADVGLSFVALNALLMQRYLFECEARHEEFAPFVINAHANARGNPNAMFRFPVTAKSFAEAKMIADPINLLDSSPVSDGAAAVVLCPLESAHRYSRSPVRVLAAASATDTLALHDREDPLAFAAAGRSARRAYEQAGVGPEDISVLEVHDAFTITTVLSLEASGFAKRGEALRLATPDQIGIGGRLPLCTMGGLKARGHAVGASGTYQIVELVQQLRGEAGPNQIANPRIGMAQSIGGSAASVFTTILGGPDHMPRR